jgi:hypothetical protein
MSLKDPTELTDAERRLLFDWYNHITTSSLIVIGGIIGFLPKGEMPTYAIAALGSVVIGATLALGASARLRPGAKPASAWSFAPYLERYAHGFVALGAGAFIGGLSNKLVF